MAGRDDPTNGSQVEKSKFVKKHSWVKGEMIKGDERNEDRVAASGRRPADQPWEVLPFFFPRRDSRKLLLNWRATGGRQILDPNR